MAIFVLKETDARLLYVFGNFVETQEFVQLAQLQLKHSEKIKIELQTKSDKCNDTVNARHMLTEVNLNINVLNCRVGGVIRRHRIK